MSSFPPPKLFALEDTHGIQGNPELGIYVVDLDGVMGDITSAIQNQMNEISSTGGGTLILPRGNHLVAGALVIPKGVRLKGVIDATQSWDTRTHTGDIPGTVIHATGGEDDPNGDPLFKLESGSSVSSLSVYYPNQVRHRENFRSYPWTIFIAGNDCTVENITLYNSYLGIRAGEINSCAEPLDTIVFSSERHRIRNVFGSVIKTGLWVDFCPDIGRIENVHFHAEFWGCLDGWNETNYEIVQDIMQDNLTAFKFGFTDWEYVLHTFVWCAKIAYHFVQSDQHPDVTRREMNGELVGVGFDSSCTGFQIDYLQKMGIVVTNGQFVANGNYSGHQIPAKTAIQIANTCNGNVRFTNCNFWGGHKKSVHSNSNSFLSLSNCYFHNPSGGENLAPVLTVNSGRIQINGCSFETYASRDHIKLNSGVASAIITSNNAKNLDSGSGLRIDNNMLLNAIIANNEAIL